MEFRSGSVVYWTAAVAMIVLALAGAASYLSLQELREAELWVVHTRDVELGLERLLADLQEAEASERGYLLAGTDGLLGPYEAARPRIGGDLRRVGNLVVDNPAAGTRQRALEADVEAHFELADRAIAARRAGASSTDLAALTAEGERQTDRLRTEIGSMQGAERSLLAVRRARAARARAWSSAADVLLVGLAIALVAVMVAVARRDARQLRRGEERLAVTIASIGDAVIATDGRGAIERMNRVAEELTGWRFAEAAGRPLGEVFRIIHEVDRSPVESPVSRVLRGGGVVGLADHTLLVARDGSERPIEASAAPIGADPRGAEGVVLVFRDATQIRSLERARAASEERFRRIADAMPQIVYVTDEHSRVEYLNRRWAEYTGADDPAPPMTEPAIHVEDRAGLAAAWAAARATETPLEAQLRLRDRTGAWRWFLTRAVPVRDPENRSLRWYGTSTDIDAQVRAGEALAEADRRKDEFLATLSHELRNPLAPIRNAAQLLRAPNATPTERLWASEVIDRQVRTMAILLDDLLDVSRITRGTIVLGRRRVTVRSIVEAATEVARPLIEARRHALVIAGDLDLEFDADPVRLTQALGNLLNNAAKYSDPGGRIELSIAGREEEVEIAVRDHGVGLEPADLSRVFEMFAQVNATRDRSDGGLGIGLALVKGLVELHGGRVSASSAGSGRGAEFRMTLPKGPRSVPGTAADAARLAARGGAGPDGVAGGSTVKVLVADDNRDGAEALARLLELAGHEVAVATDGADALAQAEARRPQVILLDIGMPQLSGYEVARRLRARAWAREVLLVAITGWGQAEDQHRSRESGFDHHLVKPVEAGRLLGLIATARLTGSQ